MKIILERSSLLQSLSHVQSIVEKRNTIAIMSNILLDARDGSSLKITASDLDIWTTEVVHGADVMEAGYVTVPAHLLFDIARKLPDGAQVSIVAADDKLTIRAGRSRFQLPTIAADDYPAFPETEFTTRFVMPAPTLARVIDAVRFAVSSEETRYYLQGVFFHAYENTLRMATTDGHRLARYVMDLPEGAEGMSDAILPKKAVNELRKLLDDAGKDNVIVEFSTSRARFTFGDAEMTLATKLIDGTFPDYTRVIPNNNDKVLLVNPKSFAQGVDRVATVASEKTRIIKMTLDQDKVTLSVNSPEGSVAHEDLPADYDAQGFDIGFNAAYLRDVLAQIDGDTVELHLADAMAPILVRQNDSSAATYVIMPCRVS